MAERPPPLPPTPSAPSSVQWANVSAYHLLLTLVNLLNLPLPKGTFIPRRSMQLRVLDRDVERLRMLKREIDPTNPDEVRGYLVAAKALVMELTWLLHQWPDLPVNPAFSEDMERLTTLTAQLSDLDDAEGARDLAYKLSVMLPFYEDEDRMKERNEIATRWFRDRA